MGPSLHEVLESKPPPYCRPAALSQCRACMRAGETAGGGDMGSYPLPWRDADRLPGAGERALPRLTHSLRAKVPC